MMSIPVALVKPEPERISVELFSLLSRRHMLSLPQISGLRPISSPLHSAHSGRSLRISKREREDPVVKEEEVEVEEEEEVVTEEEAEEVETEEEVEEAETEEEVEIDHQEEANDPTRHLYDASLTESVCF
jgi:hypothetical protein